MNLLSKFIRVKRTIKLGLATTQSLIKKKSKVHLAGHKPNKKDGSSRRIMPILGQVLMISRVFNHFIIINLLSALLVRHLGQWITEKELLFSNMLKKLIKLLEMVLAIQVVS